MLSASGWLTRAPIDYASRVVFTVGPLHPQVHAGQPQHSREIACLPVITCNSD